MRLARRREPLLAFRREALRPLVLWWLLQSVV